MIKTLKLFIYLKNKKLTLTSTITSLHFYNDSKNNNIFRFLWAWPHVKFLDFSTIFLQSPLTQNPASKIETFVQFTRYGEWCPLIQ